MPASKVPQIHFPNLIEFLGWHGTFVLGTVVIFKLLLVSLGASACPCTGHVVYGTAMLGLPGKFFRKIPVRYKRWTDTHSYGFFDGKYNRKPRRGVGVGWSKSLG